jgi:hypothetical protein
MRGTGMDTGRQNNTRTALVLVSIALAFFAGIMLKYWLAR